MNAINTGSRRAAAIMVQGTASHVGKSTLAAALCRIFARHGYSVAPFKGWNMALNSYVTADGGEIGRAQGEQAEACGIEATVHMNPILIKPSAPGKSHIIVRGRVFAERGYAPDAPDETAYMLQVIGESLALLRREYEILVLEGAGSPAELNLMERDVANMKTAALAEAPVLLVGDMERGGALAACAGTVSLLPVEDRVRVAGFILNKFGGDPARLQPAVAALEAHTGLPVLGVIPHLSATGVAEEDGAVLESTPRAAAADGKLQICVLRLPHISNFTDFDPLQAEKDVALLFSTAAEDVAAADAVILPGTRNSMYDLLFLQKLGLDSMIRRLAAAGVPIAGICGGFQILGEMLSDPEGRELGGRGAELRGLGLLPVRTHFLPEKKVGRTVAESRLPFAPNVKVRGYEIHRGQSERKAGCRPAFLLQDGREDGAVAAGGLIWGTYLHGFFDSPAFRRAWLNMLRRRRGWQPLGEAAEAERSRRFDCLADAVEAALDLQAIYDLLGLDGPRKERKAWRK
ncbi:MAG: cobyric acid synthase [Firmicutes bacterium]|nr:cobyric acid synthase [Bacillota bacterium]